MKTNVQQSVFHRQRRPSAACQGQVNRNPTRAGRPLAARRLHEQLNGPVSNQIKQEIIQSQPHTSNVCCEVSAATLRAVKCVGVLYTSTSMAHRNQNSGPPKTRRRISSESIIDLITMESKVCQNFLPKIKLKAPKGEP